VKRKDSPLNNVNDSTGVNRIFEYWDHHYYAGSRGSL